jgi:enterochelin esterase family protein
MQHNPVVGIVENVHLDSNFISMNHKILLTVITLAVFILLSELATAQNPETIYKLGPDSQPHADAPKGTLTKHRFESKIYAGIFRDYYVYVPAQYDAKKTAALMVFQDGYAYARNDGDYRVPIVFDNLIHQKAMPVTIALFVNPGHNSSDIPENAFRSSNRLAEYDELSDRYVTFLIDELIPELEKKYALTKDPKMRAIAGLSSGGICAFTAAWQRPDYFHKVLSHIGSFTNIRGGDAYPSLIRGTTKKDIKVFLQDGSNDLDNQYGNWYLANLQMEAALKFKKYDHIFVGGTEGHNGKHGGSILPESLKWLWSDATTK